MVEKKGAGHCVLSRILVGIGMEFLKRQCIFTAEAGTDTGYEAAAEAGQSKINPRVAAKTLVGSCNLAELPRQLFAASVRLRHLQRIGAATPTMT